MDELAGVKAAGLKNQMAKVSASKSQVSVEAAQNSHKVAGPEELKNIEVEMEAADHAFALMTEIRQRIEKAYKELSSPVE